MEYRKMQTVGATPSVLGYGGMRFPVIQETGEIDFERAAPLLRRAIEGGMTYFDTAWPYHGGQSEGFFGRVLGEYPRDSFYLATKLPVWLLESLDHAKQIFEEQLRRLGTDYVDFYLLHNMNQKSWSKVKELGIVEWCEQLQQQGKIRYFGFSFHDSYEMFEEILTCRKWDFCQIQLNYMDTEHQAGMKGYELAERLGVPMVIMEPVKGGSLAQLPKEVTADLRKLAPGRSDAGWALSWVASLPNVKVVLSGMSDMEQLEDNLQLFEDFRPLSDEEQQAMTDLAAALHARVRNGCTGCGYCMPCPRGVNIPKTFRVWNTMGMYANERLARNDWKGLKEEELPSACVRCGKCLRGCPQNIPIPEDLARARTEMNAFTGLER